MNVWYDTYAGITALPLKPNVDLIFPMPSGARTYIDFAEKATATSISSGNHFSPYNKKEITVDVSQSQCDISSLRGKRKDSILGNRELVVLYYM